METVFSFCLGRVYLTGPILLPIHICQGKLSLLNLPLIQIKREELEEGLGTATELGKIILGLLSFDVVGSSHLEVVSGSACIADQQVHSLRSTWAAFWCQSQRKRNTAGWTGVLGFFLFPSTSLQIPVSKEMLPTTREVPLPPP